MKSLKLIKDNTLFDNLIYLPYIKHKINILITNFIVFCYFFDNQNYLL
jgi:hypothetical protein